MTIEGLLGRKLGTLQVFDDRGRLEERSGVRQSRQPCPPYDRSLSFLFDPAAEPGPNVRASVSTIIQTHLCPDSSSTHFTVAAISVVEGQHLKQGDVLFAIDAHALFHARLGAARGGGVHAAAEVLIGRRIEPPKALELGVTAMFSDDAHHPRRTRGRISGSRARRSRRSR